MNTDYVYRTLGIILEGIPYDERSMGNIKGRNI
jgi:hypothetical protein